MSVTVNNQIPPQAVAPAVDSSNEEEKSQPVSDGFALIPLAHLVASKTNPRKSFDGPELDELAESIRQHGVLQPILVRPYDFWRDVPKGLNPSPREMELEYEIVCGERRYRAATRVGDGLKAIPAIIRELSDQEVLEIQIVENLQRKDVTPLEEAAGYSQLIVSLKEQQPDVGQQGLIKQIAEKIGKSTRYVYARMALDKLVPEAKQALAEGRIEASHADLLVRLDSERQKEVFQDHFCEYDDKFEGELAPDAEEPRKLKSPDRIPSVRDLKRNLEYSAQLLKKAAWKWQKDTTVEPSCVGCENNTASQEGADQKNARCLNETCFAQKTKSFIDVRIQELESKTGKEFVKVSSSSYSAPKGTKKAEDWSKAAVGSCDAVVPAIVVNYEGAWERAISVCLNKKCKEHFGAKAGGDTAAEKAQRQKETERKVQVKRENVIRERLLAELLSKITKLTPELLQAFVIAMLDESQLRSVAKFVPNALQIIKKSKPDSTDFAKVLVAYIPAHFASAAEWSGPEDRKKEFHSALEACGLDWQPLRAKFAAEYDKPADAKKTGPTPEQLASMPVKKSPAKKAAQTSAKKSSPAAPKKAASPKKLAKKNPSKPAKKGGR